MSHFKPGKIGVLALGLVAIGLLLLGIDAMAPDDKSRIVENGMGGPAEPPLSHVLGTPKLGLEGAGENLLAGSFISFCESSLPTEQLGPMARLDEGPVEMVIAPRQTFYEALQTRSVPHEDIMAVVAACKGFRNLRTVRRGEIFRVEIAPDGGLRSLAFDLDEESYVDFIRDGDSYRREEGAYPVERHVRGVSGTITNSLYASLQTLHAPLALATKMNDILGWDIDFSRDLRKGDTFGILYEEVWKSGEFVRTGSILAVTITNRGRTRQAFRFDSDDGRPGYFDGDGVNMQKQLMRAPLEYSRISSGFSYRRFHPVLKRWMPHMGVDYAAPVGTPVRAAGDGVVKAATTKKGNGRYIHIRHTNREYETFYLHLSRFAKGVKAGTKVSQGQIIGYVGATGYATGPHLDFRVKQGGKWVNPRNLKPPSAAPVPEQQRKRFDALSALYIEALAQLPAGCASKPGLTLALAGPPAWNGTAYAEAHLSAFVRAMQN